jgi:hexosaminidase
VVGHIAQEPIQYDGIKHGGIYTKNEIKDVVAYASKLGITIVPEIEMPGHAVAALMAYPELSCTGKPTPFNDWGVSSDVYCAGNESTFEFLENVLAEVVELFPGEYIHVGGDECPKDRWKECPKCQKRMKDEGLKDEHELQSYFIQRMEKFLNSKGRKLIGWDEILEGGLADNAVVMSWRGEEGGIEAAEQNHYVVMTPNPVCYFDHYQSNNYEPLAIGGLTTMEEIYNWSVIPSGLDAEKHNFVLGAQANLWTEYIPNPEHLEYMAYPRLCALSEKVWTKKENQNFEDFTARMATHYMRLDAKNINYRIPYPEIEPYNPILNANQKIELKNGVESSSIYYTIDGTEPTKNSKKYENPFRIDLSSPIEIKAVTIMPSGRESAVASGVYELVELAEPETPKNLIQGISYNRYNNAYSSAFDIIGNPDTIYTIQKLELPWQEPVASYGAILKAWIEVPEDGIYNFHLHVKDGGLLYINNKLVVNNDGFKYGSAKSGKAALKAGLYPFEIKYFLGRGWTELTLKYQIDNGEILEVEANQFFSTKMNKLNTRSNE